MTLGAGLPTGRQVRRLQVIYRSSVPLTAPGCASQYPFLYSADLVWDSEHNVALYVFKTTESDVYDINRRLTEGTCELFKRHPTHTDPMRYLGTFRLVEGVFPYSDSQMNFCRKSLVSTPSSHTISCGVVGLTGTRKQAQAR